MFYQLYELNHAAVQPLRAYADAMKLLYSNPLNPISHTPFGRSVAAAAELFERTTRRYGKPTFGLTKTTVDWKQVAVDGADRLVAPLLQPDPLRARSSRRPQARARSC